MTSNPEMVEMLAKTLLFMDGGWDFLPLTTADEWWEAAGRPEMGRLQDEFRDKATAALQALAPHFVERPVWSDEVKPDAGLCIFEGKFNNQEFRWVPFHALVDVQGHNVYEALKGYGAGTLLGLIADFKGQWAPCPAPMED